MQARREGITFEDFWFRAIRPGQKLVTTETARKADPPPGAVVWPMDSADRANFIAATNAAKEFWYRAYEHLPPNRGELAMSRLRGLLGLTEEPTPSGSQNGGAVLCRS